MTTNLKLNFWFGNHLSRNLDARFIEISEKKREVFK